MPKTEYVSWYCTRIWHPDLIGSISFAYNLYGAEIDFFKRYKQPVHEDAREFIPNAGVGTTELPLVYRDVHLAGIKSDYERLDLNYSVIDLVGSQDLLDPNDATFKDVDGLYAKARIYSTDDSEWSAWRRYHHIKDEQNNLSFAGGLNPYMMADSEACGIINGPDGSYLVEEMSSNDRAFEHCFLESPRITPFTVNPSSVDNSYWSEQQVDMPPGETYEVKTTVSGASGGRAALFDVNLASGDYSVNQSTSPIGIGNTVRFDACAYQDSRGMPIHSTFDKAVKWQADADTDANISEFFVLPNNPMQYAGFNIQIGPANGDNNPLLTENDVWEQDLVTPHRPIPTKSYFNIRQNNSYTDEEIKAENGNPNLVPIGLYYTDKIPSSFGIGLPWSNMFDFYEISDPTNLTMCPYSVAQSFWWKNNDNSIYDNTPTAADEHFSLGNVEIWRYSKMPLMLTSVTKRNYVGAEPTTDPWAGWVDIAELALEYSISKTPIVNAIIKGDQIVQETTGYYHNVVLLDRILVMPTGSLDNGSEGDDAGPSNYPTTHFFYDSENSYDFLPDVYMSRFITGFVPDGQYRIDVQANCHLLETIVNPLGQETKITYKTPNQFRENASDDTDVGSYSDWKYLGTEEIDRLEPTFYTLLPENVAYKVPSYAIQTYMVVDQKEVIQHERDEKAYWQYRFSDFFWL
jgi:hypothetical protein